jgi:hypothetical protein
MSRLWLRRILLTVGFLAFPAAVVPWLLASLLAFGIGSSEHMSVVNSGMVTCPEVLEWTPWSDGAGIVHRGYFADRIDPDASIIAHRIGTDEKLLWCMRLTMYQAKYQHPDGHVEIWAANGPDVIMSVDQLAAVTWAFAVLTAGAVGLVIASRLKP